MPRTPVLRAEQLPRRLFFTQSRSHQAQMLTRGALSTICYQGIYPHHRGSVSSSWEGCISLDKGGFEVPQCFSLSRACVPGGAASPWTKGASRFRSVSACPEPVFRVRTALLHILPGSTLSCIQDEQKRCSLRPVLDTEALWPSAGGADGLFSSQPKSRRL